MASPRAPELSPAEALRPVAGPVDTFVRPSQDPGDAAAIMKALSGLSPILAEMQEKTARSQQASQEALAERKIGGMTFEESKAAITSGTMHEMSSPWFKAAFDKQYGLRLANEARRAANEELATADLSTVDAEKFVADKVKSFGEGLDHESKFMTAGFAQGLDGLTDQVRTKVNDAAIARNIETRNDNAAVNFNATLENLRVVGAGREDILAALRVGQKNNRDALNISYADQDKVLFDQAKAFSQLPDSGEIIAAIGDLDRGDGVPLRVKMGPAYEALVQQAKNTDLREETKAIQPTIYQASLDADAGTLDEAKWIADADAHPELITGSAKASMVIRNRNAQAQQLHAAQMAAQAGGQQALLSQATPDLILQARTGKIAEVTDDLTGTIAGKEFTVTKEVLRETALKGAADEIERDGAAQGKDPASIRQDQIAMYGTNGEIDPLSQRRVGAALRASYEPGDVPQTVLDYFPEIQMLQDHAPWMLKQIAGSRENEIFLNSIATGMDLGYSPKDAIKLATTYRDNSSSIAPLSPKDRRGMVDDVVAKWADKNDGYGFGIGGKKIASRAFLDPIVAERIDFYAASGATGKDLSTKVYNSLAWTHTYFNGFLIDTTGTGRTSKEVTPVLKDVAAALLEAKPALKGQKITFIPSAPGSRTFRAVTATGQPIPGTDRTWDEMQHQSQIASRARLAKEAASRDAQRADEIKRNSAENGVPGSMNVLNR